MPARDRFRRRVVEANSFGRNLSATSHAMDRIVRKLVCKVDRRELRAATTFISRSRLARVQFEVRIAHGRAMTLQMSRNGAGTVTREWISCSFPLYRPTLLIKRLRGVFQRDLVAFSGTLFFVTT